MNLEFRSRLAALGVLLLSLPAVNGLAAQPLDLARTVEIASVHLNWPVDGELFRRESVVVAGSLDRAAAAGAVGQAFGSNGPGGALLIESESSSILAWGRTGGGSQASSRDLLGPGERGRVLFRSADRRHRLSVGLRNGTDRPLAAHWEQFSADGASMGRASLTLLPFESVEGEWLLMGASSAVAFLDIWTETPDGRLAVWGTVAEGVACSRLAGLR